MSCVYGYHIKHVWPSTMYMQIPKWHSCRISRVPWCNVLYTQPLKKSDFDLWQMDCIAFLRGVKWPKWHAICSIHTPHTLIDTLRNAKVNAQTARTYFKICILCNSHALSLQYNAFVRGHFFIILVCSRPHAITMGRAALEFWQLCHLGIHGIRHRLWI